MCFGDKERAKGTTQVHSYILIITIARRYYYSATEFSTELIVHWFSWSRLNAFSDLKKKKKTKTNQNKEKLEWIFPRSGLFIFSCDKLSGYDDTSFDRIHGMISESLYMRLTGNNSSIWTQCVPRAWSPTTRFPSDFKHQHASHRRRYRNYSKWNIGFVKFSGKKKD